jgi:hypothetical protein
MHSFENKRNSYRGADEFQELSRAKSETEGKMTPLDDRKNEVQFPSFSNNCEYD